MTGKTHIAGGLLAGQIALVFYPSLPWQSAAVVISAAVVGALLPDIDHGGSKISRRNIATRAAHAAVSTVTSHRGLTHTPLFILVLYLIFHLINFTAYPVLGIAYVGLLAGAISHLALDMFNPAGIMLAFPITKKRISLAPIRTGGFGEIFVFSLLGAVNILYYAFGGVAIVRP